MVCPIFILSIIFSLGLQDNGYNGSHSTMGITHVGADELKRTQPG